jgi:RND superfamily putative drug exporter
VYRFRWLVLAGAGVFLAASLAVLLRGGTLTTGTIRGLEARDVLQIAAATTGYPTETSFVVLFEDTRAKPLDARDGAFHEAMQHALDPLRADAAVLSVATPDDAGPLLAPRMINGPAHAGFAIVTLKGDVKHALAAYPAVRARLKSDVLAVTCTGHVAFASDLDVTLERDLLRAEVVSLPLALLVLLFVFRTAVAAALPVGVGGLAVAGGVAVVLVLSRFVDIAQYTVNVCSLVGLGVAIDYSLFTVSRYREELAKEDAAAPSYEAALVRAMGRAGRVVTFSGLAVGSGLAGLVFFDGSYLLAMGVGGAIVVTFAVVFALTFLPALLAVLGPRIHLGAMPRRATAPDPSQGMWHRTAEWVMRRPVAVLVPTLAVLMALGAPFFHLKMTAADVRVLPADTEARRGYDLLRADFHEQAANRVVVVAHFPGDAASPVLTRARIDALFELSRSIAKLPHVTKVESLVDGGDPDMTAEDYASGLLDAQAGDAAAPIIAMAKKLLVVDRDVLLYVVSDAAPDSDDAHAIVRQLRASRGVGDGTLLVGGETANDIDVTAYMVERTPRAVAFVVGVTAVVLFFFLGSVVLPLKAIAMNAVSIVGSFGALVWIFQDGHLFIHEARPIEPTLPPLLFCILFGLSMDYELLMLARIHEAWTRTGDNTRAVAEGLERTAGLITSAAAIMVCVFGAFALARVVLVKAVGFGMAMAVALDATLVRVLLVPATMRLFGDANWWAPGPLRRMRDWLGLTRR